MLRRATLTLCIAAGLAAAPPAAAQIPLEEVKVVELSGCDISAWPAQPGIAYDHVSGRFFTSSGSCDGADGPTPPVLHRWNTPSEPWSLSACVAIDAVPGPCRFGDIDVSNSGLLGYSVIGVVSGPDADAMILIDPNDFTLKSVIDATILRQLYDYEWLAGVAHGTYTYNRAYVVTHTTPGSADETQIFVYNFGLGAWTEAYPISTRRAAGMAFQGTELWVSASACDEPCDAAVIDVYDLNALVPFEPNHPIASYTFAVNHGPDQRRAGGLTFRASQLWTAQWTHAALLSTPCVPGQPTQIAKILADDGAASDWFGYIVAISGDTAVVGSRYHDDPVSGAGAAYIFREINGFWVQVAKLLASDAMQGDQFGAHVAIDGGTLVVGATYSDDLANNSGSAYIFREIDGAWVEVAKILASDGVAHDQFGFPIAIDGDTIVVGAAWSDSQGQDSGSAYIFREIDGAWVQVARLLPADGGFGYHFGNGVALDGDTALVGAWGADDLGPYSGSAYIFREIDGEWVQVAKLLASDGAADDYFGLGVALSGDTAVVGAYENDGLAQNSGSAYIFREIDGAWVQVAKLLAADGGSRDYFGVSVALDGDTLVVGALCGQDVGLGMCSGAAYIFREIDGAWVQVAKLHASDGAGGDNFGHSVALSGGTALVGAFGDDDLGDNSGSAYVFDLYCLSPCPADCSGDGSVNIFDFLCFQGLVSAGDPAADCNADGSINIFDFLCFQGAVTQGCP